MDEFTLTFKKGASLRINRLTQWTEILCELNQFFSERGLRCKAIYRTCQRSFGRESPANLVLRKGPEDVVRVYISFEGSIKRTKIDYILVLTPKDVLSLSMIPEQARGLHLPKVDLDAIPAQLRYADLESLFSRFDENIAKVTDR